MPLYEFVCQDCGNTFEEICPASAQAPACPSCQSGRTQRLVSMPSPLKTGAFPFKVGPVHPMASKMAAGMSGSSCGSCSSCASQNDA